MTFSLLVRSSCTAVHHHLKCTGSLIPHPTWANTSIASTHIATEDLPMEEQPTTASSPTLVPNNPPGLKGNTLCQIQWEHAYRQCHSKGHFGRPPAQEARDPTLVHNHAKAFRRDSNMVKEARREYFSKHSFDFYLRQQLQPLWDV